MIRERVGVQIGERVRISRKPNRRDPYADPINSPSPGAFTADHTVQSSYWETEISRLINATWKIGTV